MTTIKKHIHGLAGAFSFSLIIVILLLLFGFTTKLPLPVEEGILLDFTSSSSASSNSAQAEETKNTTNSSIDKNIVNQDIEESAYVVSDESELSDENSNNNSSHRIDNLFDNIFTNGNSNNPNNSNNANPFGENNDGPNPGFGELDGARSVIKVEPKAKENDFGKVVFRITVDEAGIVTDVILISTTCSDCVNPAKDAVFKWKYDPQPKSGYQIGFVTIEFKQF